MSLAKDTASTRESTEVSAWEHAWVVSRDVVVVIGKSAFDITSEVTGIV